MSGQDSSSDRLPSSYTSELHGAVPAIVSSGGSVHSANTPQTSTSSEPGAVVVPPQAASPEVPNAARSSRDAESELRRLLEEDDRRSPRSATRDRSRERHDRAERHSIATPSSSRPLTPRRGAIRAVPVTPHTHDDRVSHLHGEVYELQRQLRQAEVRAHQHGQRVEQQATAGMAMIYRQEEQMRQQFEEWGHGASSEITSLLNSFHASSIRGEEGEQMVAHLESRLRYVEGAAAEVRGRHNELNQTTAQIRAAELSAASDAQMMQARAHQEALTAQNLRAEMFHVQTVTEQLRGNLNRLENQVGMSEREREAVVARRISLDQEAAQMRDGFIAQEQQLAEVRRSLAESEVRNAAESHELAVMLQECRAIPLPPSPRSPPLALAPVPVLPISHAAPDGVREMSAVPSLTAEEHERILRRTIGPLETVISQLRTQYESVAKDKQSLAEEVSRLSGLVDSIQDEVNDTVNQLPSVGPCPAVPRAEPDATEGVIQTIIHRLTAMGVFIPKDSPGSSDGRREAARAEPGGEEPGDDEPVSESAEAGAVEETRPTEERTPAGPPSAGVAGSPVDRSGSTVDKGGPEKDRKWKRPGAVHVPKFPSVTQIPQWEKAVVRALVASSNYEDKAEVRWFKRCSRKGAQFEDLSDVGEERFHALDALLCQALMKNLPPDLHQRIRRKEDEAWQKDTTITGLQVAWMIYDYFKTEDHMSQVYGLNDLTDLTWYGDNRMLDFLQQWDFVLDHIEGDTQATLHANGEKTLRDLLFRQVEKSSALAEDIAHYKRIGKQHPDYSYRFLRDAIERSVENSHQRKIVEERRNAIRSGRNPTIENAPANPATATSTVAAGGAGGQAGGPGPSTVMALPGSAESGTKDPKNKGRTRSRKPKGGGAEEGRKRNDPPKGTNLKDIPCWFHSASHHGAGKGCSRGATCPFSHSKFMSKADFEAAERPRSLSASRRTGKGGGKGKAPATQTRAASTARRTPFHCNKFLKDGVCPYEQAGKQCKYPHLTKAEYDNELAKMKATAVSAAAP